MPSIFERRQHFLMGVALLAVICGGCSPRNVGIVPSEDSDTNPAATIVDRGEGETFEVTHRQANIIQVTDDHGASVPLHTFCLDAQGNILAGIGQGPGQIRKLDPMGNPVATWPLDIRPEAVTVGPDAAVYVAGSGKLLKLDSQGTVLLQAVAPQAAASTNARQNQQQAKLMASSISAAGGDVFLATRAEQGYGFEIWRLDEQFKNSKKIVSGLRGCCGQMDVQASENGVYVAENARHRVCHYDREGTLVNQWGGRARTGVVGFGGCCNPMNLAFGTQHDVYTAESTTGRIKRYSPDGQLLDLVGSVDIVPGCKKVSIAVSPDGGRVYMLDITRTHIVMMEAVTATLL